MRHQLTMLWLTSTAAQAVRVAELPEELEVALWGICGLALGVMASPWARGRH